jgi:hypothetical protein
MNRITALGALGVLAIGVGVTLAQAPANMGFFVTSANPGKGGNLGGLAGADAHCQTLADRIGNGPWSNVKGELIAQNVADLHSANNKLTAATALTEKGAAPVYLSVDAAGAVQRPAGQLAHDILTGTNEDGTKNAATCNNWTDGADATAMLGHADRLGRNPGVNSWNAIHASQGCSMEKLTPTGGTGLFYCFATN